MGEVVSKTIKLSYTGIYMTKVKSGHGWSPLFYSECFTF